MTSRIAQGALALFSVLVALPARAQEVSALERLDAAAERLDFLAVIGAGQEAIASGTLGPEALVHVHQQIAMAESFAGDAARARAAYERMLAIDPEAIPDESVPPRLQPPYVEALRIRDRFRVGASASISGHVMHVHVHDGLGIVTHVTLVYDLGEGTSAVMERAASQEDVPFVLPESLVGAIRYRVALLDAYGNRWFELGTALAPRVASLEASPVLEPAEPPRARRRIVRSPWLWAGVGALVVGLGVGIGVAHGRPVRVVTSVTF